MEAIVYIFSRQMEAIVFIFSRQMEAIVFIFSRQMEAIVCKALHFRMTPSDIYAQLRFPLFLSVRKMMEYKYSNSKGLLFLLFCYSLVQNIFYYSYEVHLVGDVFQVL